MNKATGIIIAILVIGFGGFLTWSIIQSQEKATNYDDFDPAKIIPANESNGQIGDHVRGNAESSVVVVEYGDMQCAGCATATPRVAKLQQEYGDRVAFVFRHFPIQGHPNSRAASAAIESAGLQGYFWEMVEAVYANQAIWSSESGATRTNAFANLFQNIAPNGDVEKFKTDLGDSNIERKITFDYNIGSKRSKVAGTPAFYINGNFIDISGHGTEEAFLTVMRENIDKHLKEAGLTTGPAATTDESETE